MPCQHISHRNEKSEEKSECATRPPEQNFLTPGAFPLCNHFRPQEDVAVVREHLTVYGDGRRVHSAAASLLFTTLKLTFHLRADRKWL